MVLVYFLNPQFLHKFFFFLFFCQEEFKILIVDYVHKVNYFGGKKNSCLQFPIFCNEFETPITPQFNIGCVISICKKITVNSLLVVTNSC
jgi:hypothetical protein